MAIRQRRRRRPPSPPRSRSPTRQATLLRRPRMARLPRQARNLGVRKRISSTKPHRPHRAGMVLRLAIKRRRHIHQEGKPAPQSRKPPRPPHAHRSIRHRARRNIQRRPPPPVRVERRRRPAHRQAHAALPQVPHDPPSASQLHPRSHAQGLDPSPRSPRHPRTRMAPAVVRLRPNGVPARRPRRSSADPDRRRLQR